MSTKNKIWNIIKYHIGYKDAINQYKIANEYIEWYNEKISCREVRNIIRELRVEGFPILSTPHQPGGYFVPADYKEVIEWKERSKKKAVKLLAIIRPVLKTCNSMFPERGVGQLSLLSEEVNE